MAAETQRSEVDIKLDPIYAEKRIIHAQIAELNARLTVLDNNAWAIHCDNEIKRTYIPSVDISLPQ